MLVCPKPWSRRRFLRAAGVSGSAAALLTLLPLPQAEAQGGPKRIIFITHGQGTDMTRWRPSGGERDFTLSVPLDPLEPYKGNLIILDGIDNEAAYHGSAGGHFGMSTLWNGAPLPAGTVRDENVGWPTVPTIERTIAARIGGETDVDAFYWGTWPIALNGGNQGPNGIAHHAGPDQPIEPELYPNRAFDRLFGGVTGDSAQTERLIRERRSVLDLVKGELGRVRTELPQVDKDRLDAHLAGFRKLEDRLSDLQPMCVVPVAPMELSERDMKSQALHPDITAVQLNMMALALACDRTRVASFQWPHSEGQGSFMESVGYRNFGSYHVMAHQMTYEQVGEGAPVTDDERRIAREDMANLTRWRSQTIVDNLLAPMLPEVRDNTLIVWSAEMSEGGSHSNRNIPIVMFQGSEFGYFDAGRYLKWGDWDPLDNYNAAYGGEPMNKVLVSICNAMGLSDITTVGDASYGTGPLEALL